MAVVVYEHNCDLCGKQCRPDQLAHLFGRPGFRFGFGIPDQPRVDICPSCQARPVHDVLGFLADNR